jgi:hypothetical protein
MLVIRNAQMAVFQRASKARFEAGVVHHLAHKYPKLVAALGEEGTLNFIRRTTAAAHANRIFAEGAIAIYIDLVIEYGEQFERAPDRTWARKILAHPKLPDHIRMDTISEKFASRADGRIVVRHDAGI